MANHYELKATETGFELSWVGTSMRVNLVEEGGHGTIEELYALTDKTFHNARALAHKEQLAYEEDS